MPDYTVCFYIIFKGSARYFKMSDGCPFVNSVTYQQHQPASSDETWQPLVWLYLLTLFSASYTYHQILSVWHDTRTVFRWHTPKAVTHLSWRTRFWAERAIKSLAHWDTGNRSDHRTSGWLNKWCGCGYNIHWQTGQRQQWECMIYYCI